MKSFSEEHPVPQINLNLCDGCGLCVKACPFQALGIVDKKAVVINPDACDFTGNCELICPVQAIQRRFQIIIAQ